MKTWIDWTTGRRLVYIEWTCRKCKQPITVSDPLRGDAELKMQNMRAQHACQETPASQNQRVGGGE